MRNLFGGGGFFGNFRRTNTMGPMKMTESNGRPTSVSVGGKGMRVTESERGTRLTFRILGTGITMTKNLPGLAGTTKRRRRSKKSTGMFE
ncbi:MAG: DUF4236 domain-containing protein [Thermomicrobiales bacterium]